MAHKTLIIPTDLERELLYLTTFDVEVSGAVFTAPVGQELLTLGHYMLNKGDGTSVFRGGDGKRWNVMRTVVARLLEDGLHDIEAWAYHSHPTCHIRKEVEEVGILKWLSTDQFSETDAENLARDLRVVADPATYFALLLTHSGIRRYGLHPNSGIIEEIEGIRVFDHVRSGFFAERVEGIIQKVYDSLPVDQRPSPVVLTRGFRSVQFL